jgi:hypothetical protein
MVRIQVESHLFRVNAYTSFENNLRNVRSDPNRKVSVLFIRSRMQDINCSSLELKIFFSLWGLLLIVFRCKIVAVTDAVQTGKGIIILGSTPPRRPSILSLIACLISYITSTYLS